MIDLSIIPQELFLVLPLAIAAGVDLYLVLLLLGAAPGTGLWEELPGAASDLGSPWVLFIAGAFYLLELIVERWPAAGLVWNAFHAVIRPLSGALLALLLLDGQSAGTVASGAVLAGLLASLTHAIRTGWGVLRWLDPAPHPRPFLVAVLEDVLVLGSVVLALDAPGWAMVASSLFLTASLVSGGSRVRAFLFAVRLIVLRALAILTPSRWHTFEELPRWVRRAIEVHEASPGSAVRGCLAGAYRLPGLPVFATGWLVTGQGEPSFFYRTVRGGRNVALTAWTSGRVKVRPLFLRVDPERPDPAHLYLALAAPPRAGVGDLILDTSAPGTKPQGPG